MCGGNGEVTELFEWEQPPQNTWCMQPNWAKNPSEEGCGVCLRLQGQGLLKGTHDRLLMLLDNLKHACGCCTTPVKYCVTEDVIIAACCCC